jgi:hypothetical protein
MTTAKTVDEQIAAIRAEAERKAEEVRKADTLLRLLPDWAHEYHHHAPHFYKLYGKDVSIHFEFPRYSSISDGAKAPDLDFIARMIAEFPPLPLAKVKDGCTSFRLASAVPEDNERCNVTPIAPFTIRCRFDRERVAQFVWLARVGEFVCEFQISLPFPYKLGTPQIVVKEDRYGGRKVERAEFDPTPAGARRIKWASGSDSTVNDFTVFWEAPDYTFADLLESLA